MRKEYDLSAGVRGKYAGRLRFGANVIILEPDVAAAFPDSGAVNETLRALLDLANRSPAAAGRPPRRKRRRSRAVSAA